MTDTPRFQLSRWVFLRLLGVTYLLAFGSLAPQLIGLIGHDGILPVESYLARAQEFFGSRAPALLPTILWFSATDTTLRLLAWGGVVVSGLAIAGVAPLATFGILWAVYLSLTVGGQTFLSFQWDVLLLEAGLVACLYAPPGWRPTAHGGPDPVVPVRWLLWSLAFKLTVLSGVTKLVSGDPTWRDFTALTYHYQTQPIPAWTSWYAHHLPTVIQMASVGVMYFIELAVPVVILLPTRFRRTRAVGVAVLCLLQLGIAVTGNYGFFNFLTIVVYLALLDDGHLTALGRRGAAGKRTGALSTEPRGAHRLWRRVSGTLAVAIGFVSALAFWHEATYTMPHPEWSTRVLQVTRPFRSINGYGLFRTMTTSRPEIIIEGTTDGITWQEYAFRWKPGDPHRRPRFVQPHMPRLDWLMWFAALDPYDHGYWLTSLVDRLLEGSPAVWALLADSPSAAAPPRSIRLALYDYRFTTSEEGRRDGAWWHREFRRMLTTPVS